MKIGLMLFVIFNLFIIQLINCNAKPYEPQVKGGFKKSTSTEYRYEPGKSKPVKIEKRSEQIFDEHGNMIEIISYDEGKKGQSNKIGNKYNEKGLLTETVYFDDKSNPVIRFTYNYDNKNNMIGNITYSNTGEVTEKGTYIYDENNFLVEEKHEVRIEKNEFSSGTTYYKNDKFGNKLVESANHTSVMSVNVSSKANLENKTIDTKTNIQTDDSNKQLDKITHEYNYDDKNNVTKDVRISFDNSKFIKYYKWDKFGNMIEEAYPDDNGFISFKVLYEYSK